MSVETTPTTHSAYKYFSRLPYWEVVGLHGMPAVSVSTLYRKAGRVPTPAEAEALAAIPRFDGVQEVWAGTVARHLRKRGLAPEEAQP